MQANVLLGSDICERERGKAGLGCWSCQVMQMTETMSLSDQWGSFRARTASSEFLYWVKMAEALYTSFAHSLAGACLEKGVTSAGKLREGLRCLS